MGSSGMTFAGVGFIVAFAIGVPLVAGRAEGAEHLPVGSVRKK